MTVNKRHTPESRFVVCVRNEGHPASLELRKIYRVGREQKGDRTGYLRIIDESGEDYIYPADYFLPIALPKSVAKALLTAG